MPGDHSWLGPGRGAGTHPLKSRIEPDRVFDCTSNLDSVPGGYRAMADRETLKVLIRPWPTERDHR